MKDFFNKIAKSASVYLDPYGENELKRMELADKKTDFENIKNNQFFDFSDLPHKKNLNIFHHEISHATDDPPDRVERLLNSLKDFNIPKPVSNIGILPPDNQPAVAQAPEVTPAQRASQMATVMAGGTQAQVSAPRTARFRPKR